MRLLLIRHAESANQAIEHLEDYAKLRHPDPPLTTQGQRQAQTLADWLANENRDRKITHLYTSPMLRAVQTVAPLAAALNLTVQPLLEAHECGGVTSGPIGNFQPLPGQSWSVLQGVCPSLQPPKSPAGQTWVGGAEPWDQAVFQGRAKRVAQQLENNHVKGEVVALITHHDFAAYLLAELLGGEAVGDGTWRFSLANTAMNCLERREMGRWEVIGWNIQPHQPVMK